MTVAYSDPARVTVSALTAGDRVRVKPNTSPDADVVWRTPLVPVRTGAQRGVITAQVRNTGTAVGGYREKSITLVQDDGETVTTVLPAGSTIEIVKES